MNLKIISLILGVLIFSGMLFASNIPELDGMKIQYKTNNNEWINATGCLDDGFNMYFNEETNHIQLRISYIDPSFQLQNQLGLFFRYGVLQFAFTQNDQGDQNYLFAKFPLEISNGNNYLAWDILDIQEGMQTHNGMLNNVPMSFKFNLILETNPPEPPTSGGGRSLTREGIDRYGEIAYYKMIAYMNQYKDELTKQFHWKTINYNTKEYSNYILGVKLISDVDGVKSYKTLYRIELVDE